MRRCLVSIAVIGVMVMIVGCAASDTAGAGVSATAAGGSGPAGEANRAARIIFLHHSTGQVVWTGSTSAIGAKFLGQNDVTKWMSAYNAKNGTAHVIEELAFPSGKDYEWVNYPYDYYNIWIKHAGEAPYRGEPTLEMLTKRYDVIVLKHCFPVSSILPDTGAANVDSSEKRLENYRLQYAELKAKMRSFPQTRFVVWTGAALTQAATTPEEAARARQFFEWVKREWDEPGDNIFVWDFYELETEGGLYLKDEYARARKDSHPSAAFGGRVAPLFAQRVVDVAEGRGDTGSLTGTR